MIASFASVQSEIGQINPVCLRVGWRSGGGHFLSIIGWMATASGPEYYDIDDPIYGVQRIVRAQLETNYLGRGRWTHSYYVDRSGSGIDRLISALSNEHVMGA